jgi:hypothetical protein
MYTSQIHFSAVVAEVVSVTFALQFVRSVNPLHADSQDPRPERSGMVLWAATTDAPRTVRTIVRS